MGLVETFDQKSCSGGEWGCVSPSLEGVMHPPEALVRELSPREGAPSKSVSKRPRYQSKRQRAMILLASSTGVPAPQIAGVVRTDESHVRKVMHAFNDRGFASLEPDYRGVACEEDHACRARPDRVVARARRDTHADWRLRILVGLAERANRREVGRAFVLPT
jgi:hypothetical protein